MRDEASSPNPENMYQAWLDLIQDHVAQRYPDVSADDVVQDTIEFVLRLRRNSARWQPTRAFLLRAADHLAHAYRQTRQADSECLHLAYVPDEVTGADEFVLEEANRLQLRQASEMLSESDRALLNAIIGDGVKPKKMADKLGISYDAVRKRKERARRRLEFHFKGLGLVIPAWFVVADIVRRMRKSQAGALLANTTNIATLVTAGTIWGVISIWLPPDPGRDHEPRPQGIRPVVTAISGPENGSPQPRPPERTTSRSATQSPATPTTSTLGKIVPSVPDKLPANADLHVAPNTDAGTKEKHSLSVDTPIGPVMMTGRREATTPAKAAVVCQQVMATCPSGPSGTKVSTP